MFDLFRSREKSVRILLGVLLGLVALSMLIYLIPGSGMGTGSAGENTVAVVGDEAVTTVDVQRAVDRTMQSQPNLPRALMSMYLNPLVNQLVEVKALAYKARQMGLRVSDEELSDSIQAEVTPALGGKFDEAGYSMLVQQRLSMTVPDFEKEERERMLAGRLENLEQQSIVVSDQDARAEYQRKYLKVGLDYISFDEKDFRAKVNQDPAAIKSYFEKNRMLFRTPEKRDGVLIVGTTADFMQSANISDAQIQHAYQENRDTYQIPERVKVRHILIKTQGKPKQDVPKLKAKADDILKELQKGGNFAELAKKDSEDPGSAQNGGELGWLTHGQTVPNFDKTAFSLAPGQLSNVIETEYGYHILQVEEKQTAHTQTLDEVRPQLMAELQKQAAIDNLKRAMDAAHAEIAKNPSQADAIAKKYNLRVLPLNGITSTGTLPDANAPEVVSSIFAASKNSVTDVVSLDAQGKAAFAIIRNIQPAHNAEFQEVQADATQKYTQAEAARLAQEAAKAAADRVRKGDSLDAIAKGYGLQVKNAPPFTIDGAAEGIGSASLLEAAFKANVGDVVGPVAAQNAQFVCKIKEKDPADMAQFTKNKDAIVQSLTSQRSSIQGQLFRDSIVSELKRKGKIKLNQDTLNRIAASFQS